jgi:hypothetical protein
MGPGGLLLDYLSIDSNVPVMQHRVQKLKPYLHLRFFPENARDCDLDRGFTFRTCLNHIDTNRPCLLLLKELNIL